MKTHCHRGEKSSQDYFGQQINCICHADKRRGSRDQQQEDAKKDSLTGAANPRFIVAREHAKSGSLVIPTTKPGDGEEVRDLPDENDREQGPGPEIERIASCRPPDQRWKGAWNRADQSIGGGNAFQRRVSKNVNDDSESGENGREKICG